MSGQVYLGYAERRARKAHRCGLCGSVVEPGCVYRRHRGIDDGCYWHVLMHRACERALGDLWDRYGDDPLWCPFDPESLSELIEEATVEDVKRWCEGDPCGARGLIDVYARRLAVGVRWSATYGPPGEACTRAGRASAALARLAELGDGGSDDAC